MDGVGDELFSGAGFPADQHGRVRMRDLRNVFIDLPHGPRRTDDVGEIVSLL